jgi:hypothetical protein
MHSKKTPQKKNCLLSFLLPIFFIFYFFFIWYVRLLALLPLWPIVPASGDSDNDCGEADGM